MGIARDFPSAFAKAQAGAGVPLPGPGAAAFISVTDADKEAAGALAQSLHDLGFKLLATRGTAAAIARMGVPVTRLQKIAEGTPNVLECVERGEVSLIINTPSGSGARSDGWEIRRAAVAHGIPCLTTLPAAASAVRAIVSACVSGRERAPEVVSLQELHADEGRCAPGSSQAHAQERSALLGSGSPPAH